MSDTHGLQLTHSFLRYSIGQEPNDEMLILIGTEQRGEHHSRMLYISLIGYYDYIVMH